MSVRILTGDCRELLATLDAESVQTCVTSPPYWRQRDYGMAAQLGLEGTTVDLASLALSTEMASDLLANRAHGLLTVTLSADEVLTIAARLNRLASVARTLHALADGGPF